MITDVTGVLLAGGKSRRMGQDKRYLHIGEQTLLERSLKVLRSVFHEVLVVIAQDSAELDAGVPVIRDLVPNCGSLGGLYTGLKQAGTPDVFVVACDMPFLHPRSIRYFTESISGWDVVIAKLHNRLHPMHARYSRRCLPVIESMLTAGELKIQTMVAHPSLRVQIVSEADLKGIDPEGLSFLNINTPADLEAARSFAKYRSDS
jgi:molybdopterin-guanine dinucleotide biosynthesis protein A